MQVKENAARYVSLEKEAKKNHIPLANRTKYDLIGKVVDETGLTRKAVSDILVGIGEGTFHQFRINPEEFILKVSSFINSKKAEAVIEHVTYHVLDDKFEKNVFTDTTIRGKLDVNAMSATKHLYNYVVYDSRVEKKFAEELETASVVIVYVKLPRSFFIPTPMGKYNPDWAVVFTDESAVKHVYFVAETKGSTDTNDLRETELGKIECAQKHFAAISGDKVQYHVVDNFDTLHDILSNLNPELWE
jgi:type III restriction enzyme